LKICPPEHLGQVSVFNLLHESDESAGQVPRNDGFGVETIQFPTNYRQKKEKCVKNIVSMVYEWA
jgi:hypothetical protein